MNNQKHTPEPWTCDARVVDAAMIIGPNGKALASMSSSHPDGEANARRIVACVNACAGVSTEMLERPAEFRDGSITIDALLRLENAERQRDELLAALEGYMAAVSRMDAAVQDGFDVHSEISDLDDYERLAHEAIAKAKGGAA